MRNVVSVFIAGLTLAAGIPAQAEAPVYQTSVKVNREALNEPAQADALYTQLKSAAREVCNEGLTGVSGWVITDRQCERMALERALSTIDHPALNRIHRGPYDRPLSAGLIAENERAQKAVVPPVR